MSNPKWSTSFKTRKQIYRHSDYEQQEVTVSGSVYADGPKANRTVSITDNSLSIMAVTGSLSIPYESIDDLVDALRSVQSAIRNDYPDPSMKERIIARLTG